MLAFSLAVDLPCRSWDDMFLEGWLLIGWNSKIGTGKPHRIGTRQDVKMSNIAAYCRIPLGSEKSCEPVQKLRRTVRAFKLAIIITVSRGKFVFLLLQDAGFLHHTYCLSLCRFCDASVTITRTGQANSRMRFPSTTANIANHKLRIHEGHARGLRRPRKMFPQTSSAVPTNREPENIEHGTREKGTRKYGMREGGCQGYATRKMRPVRLFKIFFIIYILTLLNFIRNSSAVFFPSLPPDLYLLVTFLSHWLSPRIVRSSHS